MKSLPPTKRSVLRISAKVVDPLGLLSPFVIRTKILFQTLCKSKLDWDTTLEGELLHHWKCLLQRSEYHDVSLFLDKNPLYPCRYMGLAMRQ